MIGHAPSHGGPFFAPFDVKSDTLSASLARNWWAVALRGVAAVLFGLVAMFQPPAAVNAVQYPFAVWLLVDGALTLLSALRAARRQERWGLLTLDGLLDLVVGLAFLASPGIDAFGFVLLVAAWALAAGFLQFVAAFRLKPDQGGWWMGLCGLLSIGCAVLFTTTSMVGFVLLTWAFGLWAVGFGAAVLRLAVQLRARRAAAA